MNKYIKMVTILGAAIALAACADKKNSETVNEHINKIESQLSQQETDVQLQKLSDKYQEDKIVDIATVQTFNIDGTNIIREIKSEEEYNEGALGAYRFDLTTKVQDSVFNQGFYYKSEDEMYSKTDLTGWDKTQQAQSTILLVSYIKLLLEKSTVMEMTDSEKTVEFNKTIHDKEQLDTILAYLDFPILMDPKAEIHDVALSVTMDTASGNITKASLTGNVTVQDKAVSFETQSDVMTMSDLNDVVVDLEAQPSAINTDKAALLDEFTKVNVTDSLISYAIQMSDIQHEETSDSYYIVNILNNQLYAALKGEIQDDKIVNYELVKDGQLYHEQDGKISTTSVHLDNYYTYFVNRFKNQFDTLEEIAQQNAENESEEASNEPPTTLLYREVYENDLDGFTKAAGNVDIEFVKREEDATYAIDYVVDANTLQLTSVYLWSAIATDEQINVVKTLNFGSFNAQPMSALSQSVSEKVWSEVTK